MRHNGTMIDGRDSVVNSSMNANRCSIVFWIVPNRELLIRKEFELLDPTFRT